MTRHHLHADFDDAWVEHTRLVVRGRAPAGVALRLAPRRYKSPPPWPVVEVVRDDGVGGDAGDAAASVEFRLTCPVDGLGAVTGICVTGRRHRCLVPLPPPVPHAQ